MPYAVSTLAALKASLVGRTDGAIFWADEEGRLAINEALRDWNLLTGRWRATRTLSTVAPIGGVPQVEYALGATMTYGMRVRVVGGPGLIPTSVFELDYARPSWRNETTATGGDVPSAPTLWAPISLQRIAIWPATSGAGVNNLLIDGVAATPVLVEDGDFVDIGEETVDLLTDFALHILLFKEGGPRWRATQTILTDFLQGAAEENGRLKRSQAYRRLAGLDRRRDLQPTAKAPNKIAEILQAPPDGGGA